MPIKNEVYEFFVEGKNSHLSHVLLHIASPGKPDNETQGYFFVLAEMDNPDARVLEILEDLIKDGETLYYSGFDGETREADDPEAKHFESVIEKLNRKAKLLLEDTSDRKIHIAVGVIAGNKVSFAYRGEMVGILAYASAEGPSYTNIIDEASYPSHIFFSSVIEGNFTTEEAVYLSTPHILKYFSHDRIAKMITGKSAKQSAHQMQKTLEGISSEYSFGGITLTGSEIPEAPRREKPAYKPNIGSEESMEKLLDTTRSTEDTLSPKVFSRLAKSVSQTWKKQETGDEEAVPMMTTVRETKQGRYRKRRAEATLGEGRGSILIILGKSLVWIAKACFYVLKNITIGLGRLLAIIWSLITNYNGNRKILIQQYKDTLRRIIEKITGLGIFGKIMLIVLVIGVGILSGSIMYMKSKQKEAAIEAAYQTQISKIDEKEKEAESYLLYGENIKALETIKSVKEELTSMNHDTEQKQAHVTELQTKLDALLLRVQKMTQIAPDKLVNIRETVPNAKPDSLVTFGDKLVVTGKSDTSIYFISTLTNSIEAKNAETAGELSNGYVSKDGGQIAFISGANSVVTYDTTTDSIISKNITYPNQGVTLYDIGLYNARLYALDRSNGTIYRHNPTQVGYDSGSVWIKTINDQTVLKDAISFGIDGDVYVLISKGKIIKLTAGEEQPFTISGLDPILDSPTQIETNSELLNIYILEPSRKRIIVLGKEGNFKKQFTSDVWQNPSSFAISADEKEAYVLDGATVYRFKL